MTIDDLTARPRGMRTIRIMRSTSFDFLESLPPHDRWRPYREVTQCLDAPDELPAGGCQDNGYGGVAMATWWREGP